MDVVNCGHNPAFLLSVSEPGSRPVLVKKIGASGTPVGLLPFSTYEVESLPLPVGSRLLLYTDGMTEVFRSGVDGASDDEFGEDRLLQTFLDCPARHSRRGSRDDLVDAGRVWRPGAVRRHDRDGVDARGVKRGCS